MASSRESPATVWDAAGDTSSLLLRATVACSYEQQLHAVDARGRHQRDWATYHAPYIALWESRAARIIEAPHMLGFMDFHDPYMQWYRRITRRFMTPRLHRDDMRFHTTAGSMDLLVS